MNKRINNVKKLINKNINFTLDQAISFFLKDYSQQYSAKFDETIDLIFNLNIDLKKSNQITKYAVNMPHGLLTNKRIAVISEFHRIQEAKESGAQEYGSDDFIKKIKNGYTNFDICISTPGMMPKVSSAGKILGPIGLMPNPSLGTVSDDIKSTVQNIQTKRVAFQVDKNGIIHVGVAKLSFKALCIKQNIVKIYKTIASTKPSKIKGEYISSIFMSTTYGPSIKLDSKIFLSYCEE